MKTEREWRHSLGAYALGHLSEEEAAALEAHLEGCPDCRAEAEALSGVVRLLPFADPDRFGPAPQPSPKLGTRIAERIGAEQRVERRRVRRQRFGLALSGAAAAAAVVLAIMLIPSGDEGTQPGQYVHFSSTPPGVEMGARLEPRAYGTEIRMYVKGIRSGTLCRVTLLGANGVSVPAGTFRYRWGDTSQAILSSALDLSRTNAIVVHAGDKTFSAPVEHDTAAAIEIRTEEDLT
jgi:anti-sigma-K factor RskA